MEKLSQEEILRRSNNLKAALEEMGWSFVLMTGVDNEQLDLMLCGSEKEVKDFMLVIDKANMYDELMEKAKKIKKKD